MSLTSACCPSRCPLCGQPNRCAMEVERDTGVRQPACWCAQVKFEQALLERLPPQARRLACICQACAGTREETPR
ncbi:MAG: cysteine-rich CWC family protein [Polaromonas sp.]|nr:cysteine-rich CWC family protein [Polaromonas sp.]